MKFVLHENSVEHRLARALLSMRVPVEVPYDFAAGGDFRTELLTRASSTLLFSDKVVEVIFCSTRDRNCCAIEAGGSSLVIFDQSYLELVTDYLMSQLNAARFPLTANIARTIGYSLSAEQKRERQEAISRKLGLDEAQLERHRAFIAEIDQENARQWTRWAVPNEKDTEREPIILSPRAAEHARSKGYDVVYVNDQQLFRDIAIKCAESVEPSKDALLGFEALISDGVAIDEKLVRPCHFLFENMCSGYIGLYPETQPIVAPSRYLIYEAALLILFHEIAHLLFPREKIRRWPETREFNEMMSLMTALAGVDLKLQRVVGRVEAAVENVESDLDNAIHEAFFDIRAMMLCLSAFQFKRDFRAVTRQMEMLFGAQCANIGAQLFSRYIGSIITGGFDRSTTLAKISEDFEIRSTLIWMHLGIMIHKNFEGQSPYDLIGIYKSLQAHFKMILGNFDLVCRTALFGNRSLYTNQDDIDIAKTMALLRS